MMSIIICQKLRKEVAGRCLFESEQLSLERGRKVGLIGDNGLGKSSLLKILVGEDDDYQGHVRVSVDFAYLPQLSMAEQLSGGEQVMSQCKQALMTKPSLLILDEPTANLDAQNRDWLIHQLQKFRGTLLVVSHDREFLEQVVSDIWVLEDQTIKTYSGRFTDVQKIRQKERQQQEQAYQTYQKESKRLKALAQKKKQEAQKMTKKSNKVSNSDWKIRAMMGSYDSQAKSVAKLAKAVESRLNHLERVEQPRKEAFFKMAAKGNLGHAPHRLFRLSSGMCSREDKALFVHGELSMTFGDKVALTGRNGSGKTTFVNQLLSQNLPGYYGDGLVTAHFSQDLSIFDCQATVFEVVSQTSVQSQQTILNLLGMLGLSYDKSQIKVAVLSGGERVRMALARVLLSDANLLILDEPTNYLDLAAIEALETFLVSYQGSFILISHDQLLVDKVCQRRWLIEAGHLKEGYKGDNI